MFTQATRKPYPSDLTDAQWELLAPFIPEPSPDATRPTISRREIVNGVLYIYGLVNRAQALGWAADCILGIDDDLGKSGTSAQGRMGFQRLVESR